MYTANMSDRNVYALNKVSKVVALVDAEMLTHPVLGKNLIQVDSPDACIGCGEQPDSVTTPDGVEISLTEDLPDPEEEPAKKPTKERPSKGIK